MKIFCHQFNGKDYNYAFQDDNARMHTAKNVVNWIREKKIKIFTCQSPHLERRLKNRKQHPQMPRGMITNPL